MCQAIFSTVKLENQGVKYSPFSFSTNDQVKNSNITPMTSLIRTSAARDIHLLRRSKCKIQSVLTIHFVKGIFGYTNFPY